MFDRKQIKIEAKNHLKGHWKYPLQTTLAVFFVSVLFNFNEILSPLTKTELSQNQFFNFIWFLLSSIISVATAYFYLNFVQNKDDTNFQVFLDGFNLFAKASLTFLILLIRLIGWTFLFIIPGIIKTFAYSQVTYIIADYPDIRVNDAFRMSNLITNGYKLDIFVFYLSFIGYFLLIFFSFGLATFFFTPYIETATTKLYLTLKANAIEAGILTVNKDDETNIDNETNIENNQNI